MSEFWNVAYSICKALSNWYWGEFDGLFSSLTIFIAMAHITNGMCVIIDRKPIDSISVHGIFKSVLIFILVGIGNVLDTNVFTSTSTLRTSIILFYLSVEGIIILENIVHLGLPIPEQLRKALEQMRQNRIDNTESLRPPRIK